MSVGTDLRHEVAPVHEAAALALVDVALARGSHREFFTNEEALTILNDVRAGVFDPARNAATSSIVDDAVLMYDDAALVDRWRVLDPLLDIRLALEAR
jgi:hypothetical protein